MSEAIKDAELEKLSRRMRRDWDERVRHDYRYWMSDGVDSDQAMWETGERDFSILTNGIPKEWLFQQSALEIGCGVGRLLQASSKSCSSVIGLDISQEALNKAKLLLRSASNILFVLGNGLDLSGIETDSVGFVYSFAAMGSMPVKVTASYLKELSRVLKPSGIIRLQLYLGKEQDTNAEDTLSLRSFYKENFLKAISLAGLECEFIEELVLPFEISDYEAGTVAYIVSLKKNNKMAEAVEVIESALVSRPENLSGTNWLGSRTEYLMAVACADRYLNECKAEEALKALEFAVSRYHEVDEDIKNLLRELREFVGERKKEDPKNQTIPTVSLGRGSDALGLWFNLELYHEQLKIIQTKFPELVESINNTKISEDLKISQANDGEKVVLHKGLALSHNEKPLRAAEVWSERTMNGYQFADSIDTIIVAGFGDAHHLRALCRVFKKRIIVVEPRVDILKTTLACLPCRDVLGRIDMLLTSTLKLKSLLQNSKDLGRYEIAILPQIHLTSPAAIDEIRRIYRSQRGAVELRPNIGVVSPIYGGSLPIAQYTSRALNVLKQRVTTYDLGDFYKPFTKISSFLKKEVRKNIVETHFVEMLSQLVLEGVTERPVDILICLAQAPLTPRVLAELRARGIITVMWFVEDYKRFNTWQQIAQHYDYMFVIQKDGAIEQIQSAGAGRTIYLPVGCDPEVHRPMQLTAEDREKYGSDISFVGAGYNNRRHIFSKLAEENIKIWGSEWPVCLPFTKIVQDGGARINVGDYVKVFNASKININLHSSHERDGIDPFGDFVNPRTYEIASCGAFQLVDNRKLLNENFVPGNELITFSDEREMKDKIDYYLVHPEERVRIASAGRKRAITEHTYEIRIREMLDYIISDHYERLKSRESKSPWKRTLDAASNESCRELKERLEAIYERGDEPALEALVSDIKTGKGTLTDTEQILLFMHHIKSQITMVQKLRQERDAQ